MWGTVCLCIGCAQPLRKKYGIQDDMVLPFDPVSCRVDVYSVNTDLFVSYRFPSSTRESLVSCQLQGAVN